MIFRFVMLWVLLPLALTTLVLIALALRQAWIAEASAPGRQPK